MVQDGVEHSAHEVSRDIASHLKQGLQFDPSRLGLPGAFPKHLSHALPLQSVPEELQAHLPLDFQEGNEKHLQQRSH